MTVLIGALTIGLILSLLALGVFLTFRVFSFPDITADGSFTLGTCVTATLLVTEPTPTNDAVLAALATAAATTAGLAWLLFARGKTILSILIPALVVGLIGGILLFIVLRYRNPFVTTLAACLSGALAGTATGVMHTKFKIHGLLAGFLVMTALYSVNLRVLGRSNVSLQSATTLADDAGKLGSTLAGGRAAFAFSGWEISTQEISMLLAALLLIALAGFALYAFFRTSVGTAMRATGDNGQMIKALGVDVGNMMIAGLALSNSLIALSGSFFAQYQGFADVGNVGMLVVGLASVIIGEAMVGFGHLGLTIVGAIMGSVLFRLLVAIALRAGLNPVDLKLITALFVFAALVFPAAAAQIRHLLSWRPSGADQPASANVPRSAVDQA